MKRLHRWKYYFSVKYFLFFQNVFQNTMHTQKYNYSSILPHYVWQALFEDIEYFGCLDANLLKNYLQTEYFTAYN